MNPTLTSSPQNSMRRRAIPRKRDALPNLHFQYLSIKRSDKTYVPTTEKVFYNPELLECILSHFSPRDLLVTAPLVSQLWKSIVESSPTLQIKLGFRARKQNPSSQDSSCLVPKYEINPLLLWAFPPFFRLDCKCGNKGIRSLTLNDFRRLDWNRDEKRREAYARKEASWRRMVVCQPPIETVIVSRTYGLGGRIEEHEGLLMVGEGGLRMGALWDEAQGAAERDRVLDFTLRWGMKGCCEHSESSSEGSEDDDVKKGKAKDELALRIDHWVDLYSSGSSHNTLERGFESEAYNPLEIVWTGSDNNPDVSPNANHEHYEHLTGAILPSIVLWPVGHVPEGAYSNRTQQVWVGHGRRRHLIHLRDFGN